MPELQLNDYQLNLMTKWGKGVQFAKLGEKTTACVLTTKSGFEVVGTSACVNPADFDKEIGEHYALVEAIRKLDEVSGFYRQEIQKTYYGSPSND